MFLSISSTDDHVFTLYTECAPENNQNLGYVDRLNDTVSIELADGTELTIRQLGSELVKNPLSTGFICWKSLVLLVDWWQSSPFARLLNKRTTVLELGLGVGGILALKLGPLCRHYIASDQKSLLKLLASNVEENCNHPISVVEYDWEYIDHGVALVREVENGPIDVVLASDTIYNEYLIPPFVAAVVAILRPGGVAIVAMPLRNPELVECFVNEVLKSVLTPEYVDPEYLSSELRAGYVIYVLSRTSS